MAGTDLVKKHLAEHHGETDMTGITPLPPQTQLQRAQTLAIKRQGSAGNGSVGASHRELKMMAANHAPAGAPKFNTLPNNTSRSVSRYDAEREMIVPTHMTSQSAAPPPVVANHVAPRSPSVGWDNSPDNEMLTQPMMENPMRAGHNRSSSYMNHNGRAPPTQRLGSMNMGHSFDHATHPRDTGAFEDELDYIDTSPPEDMNPRLDRRSQDRYSVERSATLGGVGGGRASNPAYADQRQMEGSTNSLSRRKTLPSIVHHAKTIRIDPQATNAPPPRSRTITPTPVKTTRDDIMDTYVIENGVRKRVKAEVVAYPRPPSPSPSVSSVTSLEAIEDKPKQLPKVYKLEPSNLAGARNRGSLPDVSKGLGVELMPRSEASKLSQARRDELRLLREQEEARRRMELVLRVADVKVRTP